MSSKVDDRFQKQIIQYFRMFDKDNDGQITLDEFLQTQSESAFLEKQNWSMEAAVKCFEAIDLNGNGVIDYSEFVCLISQNILSEFLITGSIFPVYKSIF